MGPEDIVRILFKRGLIEQQRSDAALEDLSNVAALYRQARCPKPFSDLLDAIREAKHYAATCPEIQLTLSHGQDTTTIDNARVPPQEAQDGTREQEGNIEDWRGEYADFWKESVRIPGGGGRIALC